MARFTYRIKDKDGSTKTGLVEATSSEHAANLLHERGFFIIQLKEAKDSLLQSFSHSTVSFNDIVHMTRQLATMITAGLTLVEALVILKQQMRKPQLLKLVTQLEDDVQGGKSFTQALNVHSEIFPPIYIASVRAGEASGKLDVVLSRLSDNLEKLRDFQNKVRGALIYPTVVVSGMVIVAIIVIVVVIPRLTGLYQEFNVELPLPTRILIGISDFLRGYWWLEIPVVFGGMYTFSRFRKTALGKQVISQLMLSLPIMGQLTKEAALVEITKTLSLLIDSGIPILTALDIAQEATGNVQFKNAFIAARKKVEKGFPLSTPLLEDPLFPPIVGQMIGIGEQTGKLGDSLLRLSKYFEDEADNAIHTITTLIEPLIMIVLGLGVAFLIMAVLLPIYNLTNSF